MHNTRGNTALGDKKKKKKSCHTSNFFLCQTIVLSLGNRRTNSADNIPPSPPTRGPGSGLFPPGLRGGHFLVPQEQSHSVESQSQAAVKKTLPPSGPSV